VFQNDGAPIPPGQDDQAQGPAGNHNGGVIRFGPDKKLYVFFGDQGRRGWMQNLFFGPTPPTDDDQFGGPDPDNAHLSGLMLRLNDDGSAPKRNPFFKVGATLIRLGLPEVGANLQKVFSYGHRNSFGHDFDPKTGDLWMQENADDAFSEINRVEPGMNGGWIQLMGPVARYDEFRFIEQTMFGSLLQQRRWLPSNLAPTGAEALSRLFMLPGAHYSDPEFSWKFEVAPAGFTFLRSRALGREYENNLFIGAARTFLENGYLFRLKLTRDRKQIAVDDPRLLDRVADNLTKHDGTESESLLFGRNFGVGTALLTGPNGNLYVVSLSNGTVYEIFRIHPPRGDDDREERDDDDDENEDDESER
jgi:glucose/arabinose dehydrogenase